MRRGATRPAAPRGRTRLVSRGIPIWWRRGLLVSVRALGPRLPAVQTFPSAGSCRPARFWSEVVAWINVNFFDALEAFKNFLLLNLLSRFKRCSATALARRRGAAGLRRLAARRLAAGAAGRHPRFLIAATGQWEKAMITVYLCGISVVVACLIGIPIGILAAERDRLWRWRCRSSSTRCRRCRPSST
jgi:glycine betaine/proline transport system permease protein